MKIRRYVICIVNLFLALTAFVLECLPKAVVLAERVASGYSINYSSYFNDPLKGWPILTLTIIVCTLVCGILNAILIKIDKKSIIISSLVFGLLAFGGSIFLICILGKRLNAINIITAVIFLFQSIASIFLLQERSHMVKGKL